MNRYVLDLAKDCLKREHVKGKRVLDIGSYNVNGSMREVILPLKPKSYVGIDIREGPGVDIICPAEKVKNRFGIDAFDLVVCTSTAAHFTNWRHAFYAMKQVCKGRCFVVVTSRWKKRVYHSDPFSDRWRYSLQDLRAIFEDFEVLLSKRVILRRPAVLSAIFARKPKNWKPKSLRDIDVKRPKDDIKIHGTLHFQ